MIAGTTSWTQWPCQYPQPHRHTHVSCQLPRPHASGWRFGWVYHDSHPEVDRRRCQVLLMQFEALHCDLSCLFGSCFARISLTTKLSVRPTVGGTKTWSSRREGKDTSWNSCPVLLLLKGEILLVSSAHNGWVGEVGEYKVCLLVAGPVVSKTGLTRSFSVAPHVA